MLRFIITSLKFIDTKVQGGDSQNFLGKFARFFVTLGLKILRLFRLKSTFLSRYH